MMSKCWYFQLITSTTFIKTERGNAFYHQNSILINTATDYVELDVSFEMSSVIKSCLLVQIRILVSKCKE